MARTLAVCASGGMLLGGLGAVGWHFQPVFEALGPPRPAAQVFQALGGRPPSNGPLYSGVVAQEELSWWHDPSPITTITLVAFGLIVGTVAGAVLAAPQRRAARTGSTPGAAPTLVGALVVGLLVGGGSALAWHWEPEASFGPWNGSWFWPVDVLYPVSGALLCLAAAAAIQRRQTGSEG